MSDHSLVKSTKLAHAVHVEGAANGERYSFDFKAGSHTPKSELEEAALAQALEAEQAAELAAAVPTNLEPAEAPAPDEG